MVERTEYLDRLKSWQNENVIKVVTGIRRCGKSTLLKQYQAYLRGSGAGDEQIISINFEDLKFESLLDYKKLNEYIVSRLQPGKMTYIFLDEVQNVVDFQKVVDSIYVTENTDVYITGSNSYLLSGDLATLLSGRYVEISMLPLSFKEYCSLTAQPADSAFPEYLKSGGMPYVAAMEKNAEKVEEYLEGIYNTVIVRDIEDRQRRKESDPAKRKITDIALLKTIARYLASVVGSPVSVRKVTDYLSSNGRKVSPNTVSDYMSALAQSFVFYPVDRFDIVGKQLLSANKKWYMVDLGIRNHILPRKNYDLGFSLENLVFFELLRRRYRVNIGKSGNSEVDFVASKQDALTYYQVTADMTAQETFEREMKPLKSINDNYEKIILTLDRFSAGNYDGIKVINIIDWLLSDTK